MVLSGIRSQILLTLRKAPQRPSNFAETIGSARPDAAEPATAAPPHPQNDQRLRRRRGQRGAGGAQTLALRTCPSAVPPFWMMLPSCPTPSTLLSPVERLTSIDRALCESSFSVRRCVLRSRRSTCPDGGVDSALHREGRSGHGSPRWDRSVRMTRFLRRIPSGESSLFLIRSYHPLLPKLMQQTGNLGPRTPRKGLWALTNSHAPCDDRGGGRAWVAYANKGSTSWLTLI